MALRVEKTGRRSEYILQADRESSEPTKFTLRPLTWEEEAEANEYTPAIPMSAEQAAQINIIMAKVREDGRQPEDLTTAEIMQVSAIAPVPASQIKLITKQHAVRVRYGIVEIHGLLDVDNKPATMTGAEFARQAPEDVIQELGVEIKRLSRLPEGAIKK